LIAGLARNIGVSNFRIVDLERILKIAKYKPVINQIEFHPYLQQHKLTRFLADNDILLEAYAPLVPISTKSDGPLTAVLDKISQKIGKTPAQILLKWSIQKNAIPVTTSGDVQRQKEQLQAEGPWKLSDEEIQDIDSTGSKLTYRKFWGQVQNAQWDE
jgi:diketogulonate reductase-like aldo/keto reductase